MKGNTSSLPDEAEAFLAAHPTVTGVDAIFSDISGIARGKRVPASDIGKLFAEGMAVPGSVCFPSVTGASQDPEGLGFSDGDPDVTARAVPRTLTLCPWGDGHLGHVLLNLSDGDGAPYIYEPRNILRRVIELAAARGLTPVVAFELEFYLVEVSGDGMPQPPRAPLGGRRDGGVQVLGMSSLDEFGDVLGAIQSACAAQGIETGAMTSEYAPGQFEINLAHQADALAAADSCILFRRTVSAIARRHGLVATFMAKPYADHAGSGQHMHVSLLSDTGENIFAGPAEPPVAGLRHAIGGTLATMADAMAIFAPNPNAYRRFAPDLYVPVNRSWAHDNRSVAVRIPGGDDANRRIEHRVASADANPYLCLAAVLAGLLHGLEATSEPPPPASGNAGAIMDPDWPRRLDSALSRLRHSTVLGEYLSADYLRLYSACKALELETFEREINPVEYKWLLAPG